MKGYRRIIPAGMISFLLMALFLSCVDDNYSDIRIDDSTRWKPDLSLPLGEGTLDVNDFFSGYSQIDSIPGDTSRVVFDDSLFNLHQVSIQTDYSFDYSLDQFIDSAAHIDRATIYIRVWNHYPTACRMQLYLNNEALEPVDSLFDEPARVDPGRINAEGIVTQPNKHLFEVALNRKDIETLFDAGNIRVAGEVFLFNDELEQVAFYSDYYIRLEAFLRVRLNIPRNSWYL